MKKWLLPVILLGVLAVGLLGYVVAGPYLALRGISQAIEERDTTRLGKHVDFAQLRVNLKAQLNDYVVRQAGPELQSSLLGSIALSMAGNLAGAGVDAMVTPAGIAAVLQGHGLWNRSIGNTRNGDTYGPPAPAQPLKDASHRFESTRRFVATTHTADGKPVSFVLSRDGLRWKLTDIRLPLQP